MHDAHARPPPSIRELFKQWRKQDVTAIQATQHLVDSRNPDSSRVSALPESEIPELFDLETITEHLPSLADAPAPDHVDFEPRKPFEINGLPGTHYAAISYRTEQLIRGRSIRVSCCLASTYASRSAGQTSPS